MTTFYYSGLQRNKFLKLSYIFFKSKCAANYVILFGVYDGFIGQKSLKIWRQDSLSFGPGWGANITRIRSWTFHLPCTVPILFYFIQAWNYHVTEKKWKIKSLKILLKTSQVSCKRYVLQGNLAAEHIVHSIHLHKEEQILGTVDWPQKIHISNFDGPFGLTAGPVLYKVRL